MKVSLQIFRLSRKVLMIVGGVLLLSGVAGATALYIGKDKLLGPSGEKTSDLECTSAQVVKIHRKDRFWIRKYIKMEPADGLTRVKTALRVAAAVFEKEKPDLVQVVVLDENGPTLRADMNGHAVGADVVYVPHPEKLASLEGTPVLQARYTDGMASSVGEFYGEKMHMPEDEAAHYIASLSEKTDCLDPPAPEGAAKAEGEGGEAKKKEGGEAAKEGKPAGEHGAAPAEASGGEGEAKPAEAGASAEGAAPVSEGEAKVETGKAEGEAAKTEAAPGKAEKGWFASVKSMVFGDAAPEKPDAAKSEDGKGGAAAGGEAAPAEGAAAEDAGKETPASGGEGHAAAEPPKLSEAEQAAADEKVQAEAEADARQQQDWLTSIRNMVPPEKAAEPNPAEAPSAAEQPPAPAQASDGQGHSGATNAEAQQDPLQPGSQPTHAPDKAPHGEGRPEVKAEAAPPAPGAHQPPSNPG